MNSTEQKILWLTVGIFILSLITVKILYTQFGKDSLFRMPTSYYKQNDKEGSGPVGQGGKCSPSKLNIFNKCPKGKNLCPGTKICLAEGCNCPVQCIKTKVDTLRMCGNNQKLCPDLKTCVPKECNC